MKKVIIVTAIIVVAIIIGIFVINIYEADTEVTKETTDEEVLNAKRGYGIDFAKTAARFRDKLIEKYGYKEKE